MAAESSSSSSAIHDDDEISLFIDDLYFSALYEDESIFPISDEIFAEELQLQEVMVSSLSSFCFKMENSNKILKGQSSGSRSRAFCMICMDTKKASDMFTNNGCSHTFCEGCISKYVAARIQDNIANVECPDPKCIAVLEPEFCQSFVPKEVFERWGNALCEAMIVGTQRFYCPYEDCSALMVNDGSEVVRAAECGNCRRMFCAQCRVVWHAEIECEEYQKLKREGGAGRDDILTMKLANSKKWRRCPNCKIYVDKIQGCLHITCRCGKEFCYGCGSGWSPSHACP